MGHLFYQEGRSNFVAKVAMWHQLRFPADILTLCHMYHVGILLGPYSLYILAVVAAMNLLWQQSKKICEYESDTSKFNVVSEPIANLNAKLDVQ